MHLVPVWHLPIHFHLVRRGIMRRLLVLLTVLTVGFVGCQAKVTMPSDTRDTGEARPTQQGEPMVVVPTDPR